MFIESARPLTSFRNERNAEYFARSGDDESERVAVNISALCGDDSVYILQSTYQSFCDKAAEVANLRLKSRITKLSGRRADSLTALARAPYSRFS
jgi:hypothetical protein